MLHRLSRVFLLAVAGCSSAPSASPPEPPKDLSLLPGTTWIYVDEKRKEYMTRVEGPADLEGIPCVKIRGATVGVSESRWDGFDVSYWSVRDGVPMLHGTGEDDWKLVARQPVPLYRRDAARGLSWDGRFFSKDAKTGIEDAAGAKFIAGGRQSIGTAIGTFDAYHVAEEWRYKGEVKVRIESWYADGVGVVRQVYRLYRDETILRTLNLELKAYLPVKPGGS